MKCAWVEERLLVYLAGELAPPEKTRLLQHLETCGRCTALAERLAAAHEMAESVLRTDAEAPAFVDAGVMEAVRQIPPRRPFWLPRRPLWNAARVIAMAATAACLFLIGFLSGRGFPVAAPPDEAMPLPAGAQKLNVELLGVRHQGVLAAPPSTEVALASARQQAEALSRRAELPVKAVDLKNLGARLVALDVTEVQGVPVAHLCYLWNDTPVSLFQVDARRLVSPTLRQPHVGPCYILREVGGLRYVVWCVGMTNYALVARARPEELMKMADYARRQLELL